MAARYAVELPKYPIYVSIMYYSKWPCWPAQLETYVILINDQGQINDDNMLALDLSLRDQNLPLFTFPLEL